MLVAVSLIEQAARHALYLPIRRDLGQDGIDLCVGKPVPPSDGWPKQHGSILGQEVHGQQEWKSPREHAVQDPSRRSLRVGGQKPAHDDVRVDDGGWGAHRLRCALVSAVAIRSASFSESLDWRLALATICAARLMVLTP